MAKVLAMTGENDGCTLWRVLLPYTELQRQGVKGIEWGDRNDSRLANVVQNFDAVILPRLHWPMSERAKSQRWFDALHRAGKAIIYEMDDDMLSDDFIRRIMWRDIHTRAYAEERRECIRYALRACDGVTVSSQRLATMVRNETDRPVKVVENYIDLRWFRAVQKKNPRTIPGLTIGWAGSLRPDSDLDMMAEAWGRIAARYPHVTFVVQGRDLDVIYKHVPATRIAMLPWMPISAYPAGLANVDIGCCALADTTFNRAKTFIKALEYGASGAAVVASPTVYNQVIDSGVNGYIAATVDEWEAALATLVEDYRHRRDMSKKLLSKIRSRHGLEKNAWRWVAAWDEIVDDFRGRASTAYRGVLLPKEVMYGVL